MERYYQKEIECASQEQIRSWQDERLVRQVRHVWDNCPITAQRWRRHTLRRTISKSRDDLYKLPFLSKADLREAYPFGLLAEPLEKMCPHSLDIRHDRQARRCVLHERRH